jgi:hypothetical protein
MPRWLGSAALILVLAACSQQKLVWVRTDGQPMGDSQDLSRRFELDRRICDVEMQKANLSASDVCSNTTECTASAVKRGLTLRDAGKSCMAERGYTQVPAAEAENRAASLLGQQPRYGAAISGGAGAPEPK